MQLCNVQPAHPGQQPKILMSIHYNYGVWLMGVVNGWYPIHVSYNKRENLYDLQYYKICMFKESDDNIQEFRTQVSGGLVSWLSSYPSNCPVHRC